MLSFISENLHNLREFQNNFTQNVKYLVLEKEV